MQSNSKKIIKNTGYLYIKTLVSMFVMLYVTRIVLNSLGAEDFGIYDVVGGAIAMLGFFNTSMAGTVQRFLNNAQGKNDVLLQKKIYNIGIAFHVSIAVFMVLVLIFMSFFLFHGILNIAQDRIFAAQIVYFSLVVNTFFNIITVPYDSSINAHEDMLTYSIIGIIDIFLKLGVAMAIMYTNTDKLVLYGLLMMIVPISTYFMMMLWCKSHYIECERSIREYFDKGVAKQMIAYSGWSLIGTTSHMIGNYGNGIVMNHFYGTILNAAMGIANQFQGMLMVLASGMLRSLNPVIYKSGSHDLNRMMEYSYMGCKYSYLLLALLALPVIIETPYIMQLWLVKVPVWCVLFVRLQLLRCLLEQLTTSFDKSLGAVGRIKEINAITFILNLLPIFILFVLYSLGFQPYWHFIVAIACMVVFVSIAKIFYCLKYCNLSMVKYTKVVLFPCFLITFITLISGKWIKYFIHEENMTSAFLVIALMVFIYLLAIYFSLNEKERSLLIEVKCKIFRKVL